MTAPERNAQGAGGGSSTPRNPNERLRCCRCQWEGAANETQATASGSHLRADCPQCGSYIKFVATDLPRLRFGKYKGQPISEVVARDFPYVEWLLRQPSTNPHLRRLLHAALEVGRD